METLWFYLKLGFWHVIDWEGLDHFYFISTLALPFAFSQFRTLLWWVTLFTIGHTLSLIGNFYLDIPVSSYWIELLIPFTIALNTFGLFFTIQKKNYATYSFFYSIITVVFGIIHGLGFGRYFKMLIPEDQVSLSLFSFALGVEGAQVVIVIGVLLLSYLVLYFLKIPKIRWEQFTGALILIQALIMISDRI